MPWESVQVFIQGQEIQKKPVDSLNWVDSAGPREAWQLDLQDRVLKGREIHRENSTELKRGPFKYTAGLRLAMGKKKLAKPGKRAIWKN